MTAHEDVPVTTWEPVSLSPFTQGQWMAGWSYVLIEDIVDRVVELAAWGWPTVDQNGRLLWPEDSQPLLGTILMPRLRQQLYTANGLRRSPRPGDTFAVPSLGDGWQAHDIEDLVIYEDLNSLFLPPVFDISAEARKAAKIAYLGANTAVTSQPVEDEEAPDDLADDLTEDAVAPELSIAPPADPPEGHSQQG